MDKVFDNEEDCRSCLQQALALVGRTPHESDLLEVYTTCCYEAPPETGQKGFQLLVGSWVIRDDDLKVFDVIKNAIVALAAANFVFASMTAAGVTGIVAAVVQLLKEAYRSGAMITPSQAKVLVALKSAGRPLDVGSLLSLLPRDQEGDWNEDRIRAELSELASVHTRKGFAALVECNTKGHWTVKGV